MTAQSRGWGPPCSGAIVTLRRSDGVKLPVRKDIAELVARLCDETERLGYNLKAGWCWGYACRKIRGSSSWSNHAWGLAVDLNAPENPMGPRTGKIRKHPKVIALWKSYGFRWGGDYSGRADDMHFEFVGTPADAKRHTERARALKEDDVTPEQWKGYAESVSINFGEGLGNRTLAHAVKGLYQEVNSAEERLAKIEAKIDQLLAGG